MNNSFAEGKTVKRSSLLVKYFLFLACFFLLVSCKAEATVVAEVEPDGSGIVRVDVLLDDEAADALFDLDNNFQRSLGDLEQSGWGISPLEKTPEGRLLSVEKKFDSPEQFNAVMKEVSSSSGMFQNFVLVRENSFGRVELSVSGTLDGSRGLDSFSDPALDDALGSVLSDFARSNGVETTDISVLFLLDLPGDIDDFGAPGASSVEGSKTSWTVPLGTSEVVPVQVTSVTRSIRAQVLRGLAVLCAIVAALIALSHILRMLTVRSDERSQAKPFLVDVFGKKKNSSSLPSSSSDSQAVVADTVDDVEPDEQIASSEKVVVLDGMGVMYQERDNIANLLVPFAHEHGSVLTDSEIVFRAQTLTMGRMSPSQFWSSLGVQGDPTALSEQYLSLLQLSPGVVKFMVSLRERGIKVGCMINDCVEWAEMLRAKHSLGALVDIWVISGAVGVRKPSLSMFEVLRRVAGGKPGDILYIEDELEPLEMAREFGFRTALYDPSGVMEADGHIVLRNLVYEGFELPSE